MQYNDIKIRPQCLEQIIRMDDNRLIQQVPVDKPGGKRKAGRPKIRWLDTREKDFGKWNSWQKGMCYYSLRPSVSEGLESRSK